MNDSVKSILIFSVFSWAWSRIRSRTLPGIMHPITMNPLIIKKEPWFIFELKSWRKFFPSQRKTTPQRKSRELVVIGNQLFSDAGTSFSFRADTVPVVSIISRPTINSTASGGMENTWETCCHSMLFGGSLIIWGWCHIFLVFSSIPTIERRALCQESFPWEILWVFTSAHSINWLTLLGMGKCCRKKIVDGAYWFSSSASFNFCDSFPQFDDSVQVLNPALKSLL